MSAFAANWRVLALRGLAALIFGFVVLSNLPYLAPFIGVFVMVGSIAFIDFALRTRDRQRTRQA